MNIIDIYNKYAIPERLQMHMLRVAAMCKLILDNLHSIQIDENLLIRIALLHDMGNIVKISDDDEEMKNPLFAQIRQKYIDKYGRDDHKINIAIGEEVGLTEEELSILDKKQLRKNKEIMESDNYILKICAYCDQRVSPTGVESLVGRLKELQNRHKNKPNASMYDPKTAAALLSYALEIEKQVMNFCNLKPYEINDESISIYIQELSSFHLKVKSK